MKQGKVLVISTEKRFSLNLQGRIVDEDDTRSKFFWERYLLVFSKVIVVARVDEEKVIDSSNFVESDKIEVFKIYNYQGFLQGLLKYKAICKDLETATQKFRESFFLLRLPGAIGNILSRILRKNNIEYSIELVGNPYEVFATQGGILSKILAYTTKRDLKTAVRYAKSIAYVTERYLQNIFPFSGGFQTNYSSLELNDSFLKNNEKSFQSLKLSMIGVGNLEMPYKGVEPLLKALNILQRKGIDFKLTWIGDGKLKIKYKGLASNYGLSEQVNFIGAVRNDEIFRYFERHNIFILPSLTEGLPRAMVEAMASRMICLGSNVGGIPELLDDDFIFKTKSPLAIARKLIEVHSNFEKFKSSSARNYREARKYLPEELAKRRLLFLESICDKT